MDPLSIWNLNEAGQQYEGQFRAQGYIQCRQLCVECSLAQDAFLTIQHSAAVQFKNMQ